MAGGLTAAGRPVSPGILNRMVTGGAAGAGALALSDIVEDPFGAPSRALTGAAFGGALGAGAQAMATRSSPAAQMLAKVQTTGTLSEPERLQLEQMLADTYSGMS